jgi:hypothetical protein
MSGMLLTGHQPNYLPYLGFFEKLVRADCFLIVDNVQFVKRGPFGWIHRNKVRTADGWTWLTIPVQTKGKFTQNICDVEIDNRTPWRRKHWRTLQLNYGKAPFFADYAGEIEAVFEQEWTKLSDLTVRFIELICGYLQIEIPMSRTSERGITGEHGTDLVVSLCRAVGADRYLSGAHGRDYLDIPYVESAGITLEFQNYTHPVYNQVQGGEFVPYMSALDLLFNHGPDSRAILMGEC